MVGGSGKDPVPDVINFSCWSPVFQHPTTPSAADVAKAVCSCLLGLLVIVVNIIFILAVNGKRHAKHISFQVSIYSRLHRLFPLMHRTLTESDFRSSYFFFLFRFQLAQNTPPVCDILWCSCGNGSFRLFYVINSLSFRPFSSNVICRKNETETHAVRI